MKAKRVTGMLLVSALAVSLFTGCGGGSSENEGGIKEFTAFFAVPGAEINDDNEIQQIIAEKTGAKVDETWLTGQTASEAVGTLIAGGEYPDFIDGGDAMGQLYEAGALVPLDDYLDDYPNIKAYYSDEEWNKLRRDDGHIYWIQQFQNIKGEEKATTHNDEAFWIQTRVLEWAGYPEVNTLEEYFDLLESYIEANPTMEDGTENIAYTILCEDWRYYCLENAPQFLDGYPNDGSVIVDPDELKIIDYNTTDTARRYFQKLNEEYQKGYVDPESFTQTYDEYIAKLSTYRKMGTSGTENRIGYSSSRSRKNSDSPSDFPEYCECSLHQIAECHDRFPESHETRHHAQYTNATVLLGSLVNFTHQEYFFRRQATAAVFPSQQKHPL